jgi:signal transduction histidine kinase
MDRNSTNTKRRFARAPTRHAAIGALLGLGAPAGYFVLRRLFSRSVDRVDRLVYTYLTIATPIVFAAFGRVLGAQHERLQREHRDVERLREEFAEIVAHDLRNPIAMITMQLDLLQQDAIGDVNVPAEALRRLSRGAHRLDQMVGDLLDASHIEVSRLNLHPEPVELPAAVTAVVARLGPTFGKHPIRVVVSGSPPRVRVDPSRLDQVLSNLVDNAAKYSPEDAPITISIEGEDDGAVVKVRDQGYGIAPEDIPLLFDRIYQAKRARARKTGLGLGLYIAKGLVEAHGGRISVESQVDRGSTFAVWLPAAR